MGYTHDKFEVNVATASLATAADIGTYAPGFKPVIIRAFALVFTVAANATGQVTVDKRITAGSDTGRVADQAVINYTTTTGAIGNVVYKDGLNIEIQPGAELIFEVTDGTPTAGTAHLIVYGEFRQEEPANVVDESGNQTMFETT